MKKDNEVRPKASSHIRVNTHRSILRSESAQALVELALMIPVLLLLVVGVVEFGRVAYTYIAVSDAARAGVQYGAQDRVTASDTAGITQAVKSDAGDIANLTVTPTHYCVCSSGSASTCQSTDCPTSRILEYVKVDTQTQIQSLFHYHGLPQSFTVKGEAVMRVSQ